MSSTERGRRSPRATSRRTGSRPSSWRRSSRWPAADRCYPGRVLLKLVAVWHVIISMALVGLILMHSGRETGLGGMGFTPQSQGGTHIVERNLTRLTVLVGLLFFANTVLLFHLLK